jgi:hypothetical protein
MAIDALFAENEGVRPQAAMSITGEWRLRLADDLVDPVAPAAQADADGRGMLADEGGVGGIAGDFHVQVSWNLADYSGS